MADGTHIEWTDATWNPITGCAVVSPGCTNCYAMRLAGTRMKHHPSRAGLTRETKAGPVWTGEVRFNEQWLDQPLRWRRPRMIFVCAHGDLFAPGVTDAMLDQIFAVMALAQRHVMQVLTKRPDRMREYLSHPMVKARIAMAMARITAKGSLDDMARGRAVVGRMEAGEAWPLPNVWAGVSVEDQTRADERVPLLLDTPAAVRWVSAEPLLGSVDFHSAICRETGSCSSCPVCLGGLDWIVAGGESGPGARPMHPDWARSLRDQCATAGVPFLFKQWGSWKPISEMSEAETNALYRSNRLAMNHEDQGNIDEMYGRTCIVENSAVGYGGVRGSDAFRVVDSRGGYAVFNVGKKAAGRFLDGVLHDAYPQSEEIRF